jgi:hypothetical protein
MNPKSLWKSISPVIDLVLDLGLVAASIIGIMYMYILDAYSFGLLATFCFALSSSVWSLVGNLFKPNE